MRLARHVGAGAALFALAAVMAAPSPAAAYRFNEPHVRQIGPDTMVYDWSTQSCESNDITDGPARAFRDDSGKVQLITTHFVNYRFIGPSMDSLTHPCTKIMSSSNNGDPSRYDAREWIASPWTPDGKNIYSIVHNEYQGQLYNPAGSYCNFSGESQTERFKCWFNALTSAQSTNSGATYTQRPSPTHLVAAIPYQYAKDGPNGYFGPSNTVRSGDGYFYVMFRAEDKLAQQAGTCLMRTRDLSDPTSWRAWDGSGFTVQFRNPYTATINPADHVCAPIPTAGGLAKSLTYNTYLRKWMLVGETVGSESQNLPPGVYYLLSDNLVHWHTYRLLMEAEITWTRDCVPPDPIRDSSVLDPNSTSRNFETVGQRAYLFFTVHHMSGCSGTLDRDLRRIEIEFSNQQPGGPTAQLAASSDTATVGETVQFDASASTDADGSVERFQWDLDGDGTFERDTGKDPTTQATFTAPEQVTVTVRVSDDDGKATDETEIVRVAAASASRPAYCKQAAWKQKRACKAR